MITLPHGGGLTLHGVFAYLWLVMVFLFSKTLLNTENFVLLFNKWNDFYSQLCLEDSNFSSFQFQLVSWINVYR